MQTGKKNVLVLASGGKKPTSGGSGFLEMAEYACAGVLDANIVGVISNNSDGGVKAKAAAMGIHFKYWAGPFTAEGYQVLVNHFEAEYVMCSGWIWPVRGLMTRRTVNIHPGLPPFVGKGMWGHHVHEATMQAFHRGEIKTAGMMMHFVTDYDKEKINFEDPYDTGPEICRMSILIRDDDTDATIGTRVNEIERVMQSRIFNLVVSGDIWLGPNEKTVQYSNRAQWVKDLR